MSRPESVKFLRNANEGLDVFLVDARKRMNTQFAGRPEDGIFTLAQAFSSLGHAREDGIEYLSVVAASAIGRVMELEGK
jgi:hypothetical protein